MLRSSRFSLFSFSRLLKNSTRYKYVRNRCRIPTLEQLSVSGEQRIRAILKSGPAIEQIVMSNYEALGRLAAQGRPHLPQTSGPDFTISMFFANDVVRIFFVAIYST